jgi:hypothetical protein
MIRIGVRSFVAGGGNDADAQAFIDAAAITDVTQQSAINTLVLDLKNYGIWTKMKAIYPFVGGTASTHKWNLKDPRDLNAAFRLVFSGGGTHSSTGWLPNGTNGFANTFFNISNNFISTSNASMGCYLRTDTSTSSVDIGAGNTTEAKNGILIYSSFNGSTLFSCAFSNTFISPAPTNNDSRGFYSVVRDGGVQRIHKRGDITINLSKTEASAGLSSLNIYIGGGNPIGGSGSYLYSDREQAFAFIGDIITQTEIDNLYTAVQAYQTTLSRNV